MLPTSGSSGGGRVLEAFIRLISPFSPTQHQIGHAYFIVWLQTMEEGGSEELLSLPTTGSESFQKARARSGCSYRNFCGEFRLRERDYVSQYAHIYFARLQEMRPRLEEAAARKWGRSDAAIRESGHIFRTPFRTPLVERGVLERVGCRW